MLFKTELYVAVAQCQVFLYLYTLIYLEQISLFVLPTCVHTPPSTSDLFQLSQGRGAALLIII